MTRFTLVCLKLLGLLLPLHGAITVFLPENMRFWKEIVVFLLALQVVIYEYQAWQTKRWQRFSHGEWFSLLFLALLELLIWIADDRVTAFLAARYLGLGFLVYFIVSRLIKAQPEQDHFKVFAQSFVAGCVVSVLYGTWAKFGGGFGWLKAFYSTTISSWVPGQTIPLYHETGPFIRMQGASSGPGEFSHILFASFFLLLFYRNYFRVFTRPQTNQALHIILLLVVFWGILQSFSRAVVAASIFLLVMFLHNQKSWPVKTLLRCLVLGIAGLSLICFTYQPLRENLLHRAGHSDHITRPIEVFRLGLEHPFLGNLGSIGPAARSRNLALKNDDKAPIAENIFVDYFAQTGFVGLYLVFEFWRHLFWRQEKASRAFLWGTFFLANVATIFDMTPLSITFFLLFAFLTKNSKQIKVLPSAGLKN